MAPTAPPGVGRRGDIEVLLTGFGPFSHFGENPSWLAVAPLHDTYYECAPSLPSGETRRIHIQCIQIPVVYSSVLDVIPRIHGNEPRLTPPEAQPWLDPRGVHDGSQGDGRSFPHGYTKLKHVPMVDEGRQRGYDVVLHVGVGRPGAMRIETRARKSGYRLRDRLDLFAPLTGADPATESRIKTTDSEAILFEAERANGAPATASIPHSSSSAPSATLPAQASLMPQLPTALLSTPAESSQALKAASSVAPHRALSRHDHPDAPPRGFPESAYPSEEGFLYEEKPIVDTTALLDHLLQVLSPLVLAETPETQRKGNGHQIAYVQPSDDAGLFLCEYIYYASLAESKRAHQRRRDSRTKVLFMHCPPIGNHLSSAETTLIVREAALYMAALVDLEG